jgi:hypothetical protein
MWDSRIFLMVECNDLRRRWASNVRKARILIVIIPTNIRKVAKTANTNTNDLPLPSSFVHEMQEDLLVLEKPDAHA